MVRPLRSVPAIAFLFQIDGSTVSDYGESRFWVWNTPHLYFGKRKIILVREFHTNNRTLRSVVDLRLSASVGTSSIDGSRARDDL
jgi:hypothetical protein